MIFYKEYREEGIVVVAIIQENGPGAGKFNLINFGNRQSDAIEFINNECQYMSIELVIKRSKTYNPGIKYKYSQDGKLCRQ